MNLKIVGVVVSCFLFVPVAVTAYVDCRETAKGCTVAELVRIGTEETQLTVEDRQSALLQAVKMLQEQIIALQNALKGSTPNTQCINLNNNLLLGSTDQTTGGEVTKLQQFLVAAGVYPEARITGQYGNLTAQAVMRWQKANGMDFVTVNSGVGPMTREKLRCGNAATVSSLRWNVTMMYPKLANDFANDPRKYEQSIKATVTFSEKRTREYDLGTAHGCTASTASSVVAGKKVLGTVDCYFALTGKKFTAYEQNGKFFIERFDDDASGRTAGKTTILVQE